MDNHRHYLDRPVFISGFHKSGTTLLLSLLDGHPELVVFPEELHFFEKVLFERNKARAIREETGFKMLLPDWDVNGWSSGDARFREGYPEFNCVKFDEWVEKALKDHKSEKHLLTLLMEAYAKVDQIESTRKIYWVSKTPRDEIFFPVMLRMFGPDFKFIYIVRDPRDVYLSITKKNEIAGKQVDKNNRRIIDFSIYWQTQLKRVLHYQKKYSNIHLLRFEDLLLNTEITLTRLCEFLQIAYSDELRQPTRHGKLWGGNSAFSTGFKGLSKEPIGRFNEKLNPRDRILLEYLLRRELRLLNYSVHVVTQFGKTKQPTVRWLEYWITALRYQRWYFFKQYYTSLRYSFNQIYPF